MQIEQIHALHIDECGISCVIAGFIFFLNENGNDIRMSKSKNHFKDDVMSSSKNSTIQKYKTEHESLIVVMMFARPIYGALEKVVHNKYKPNLNDEKKPRR